MVLAFRAVVGGYICRFEATYSWGLVGANKAAKVNPRKPQMKREALTKRNRQANDDGKGSDAMQPNYWGFETVEAIGVEKRGQGI